VATSPRRPERHLLLWVVGAVLSTACRAEATRPPEGIVVVCLDTLRADRTGVGGHPGGLTPNLDRLAAEGVYYDNAHAQANETVLSHASMFTGRYASELGPFSHQGIPEGTPTLAGRLHAAGWETGAVVAGGHMARAFGMHAGFQHYDDTLDWGSLADTGPPGLRWVDGLDPDRPFFLFVHGYDTHDRYLKPTPFGYSRADADHPGLGRDLGRVAGAVSQVADGVWVGNTDQLERWATVRPRFERGRGAAVLPGARALTDADVAHLSGLYDGSVAWADAALGLFVGELEQRDLLDKVWLVVLSDHGHELGSEGSFHHRFALTDETLQVPLVVRPPGGLETGRVETGLVDLLDVFPTLLSVGGAPSDASVRGQALWAGGVPRKPRRSTTFAEGRLRLLSARDTAGSRLTAEGLSADHPDLVSLLAETPVGGPSYRLTGSPDAADDLQHAIVGWRTTLAEGAP